MSKQYGLILPGQQKKPTVLSTTTHEVSRPSIFDESSDSADETDTNAPPKMKLKAAAPLGVMERRMARRVQEKALAEDPTIFQYDELYDEMATQRDEEKQSQQNKDTKKPKYIGRLIEHAERRKLENELRIERQVQKEREQEGEEFKDKESFVTAAYRKKLEEMRKMEEQEKRDEYLEAIGDVTKQKDLDGFYRHLFEQKTGTTKEVQKPDLPANTSAGDNEIAYKPIKSGKPQQRAYRKRHSSVEDEEEATTTAVADAKKQHLTNNIDADSDFSIDSSTDDEEDTANNTTKIDKNEKNEAAANKAEPQKIALNLDDIKKEKQSDENEKETPLAKNDEEVISMPTKPKRDMTEIWKKRTVGDVFDAALQRYYERKAARSA